MLPDLTGARAIQNERLALTAQVNTNGPAKPGTHSLIERLNLRVEAKLHDLVDRRRSREQHPWHWPHPLAH